MKALAVLIGAGLLGVATQADATIYIGVSATENGPVTQIASDVATPGATGVFSFNYNGFSSNISAQGFPTIAQPGLQTTSINTKSTAPGSLTIYVTQTDLKAFKGNLVSSFTANSFLDPATSSPLTSGVSVTEATYYSAGNQLFGGTLLDSNTFTSIGSVPKTSGSLNLAGPFSETAKYVVNITAPGGASVNDTINIGSAVPEPASWAMMLAGFGFIGASLRQRRRATVSFG